MTIHLSIVLFLPLAAALVAAALPARIGRWVVVAGTVAVLAYALVLVFDFDSADPGLQYVTSDKWIPELGIRYQLGVDGLNLFLIALTALLWVPSTIWAAVREHERTKLYLFHLALGETAILGAFMAQGLGLFVVFFDLMLVPFYFLIGGWGQGERVAATTKFVIFTLFGSLLMLAGAIALGVLATPDGGSISYSLADLQQRTVGGGTQDWIFLLFALAFLIKAALVPFHGWVVDTYRATPIPVLVLLSAVMSKVGVYAFLRIVLPILPDASVHFQDLILVLAVVSILYGSVLAFSQDEPRLVVAYSSIAQLGFICLGIFSLDPKGAQGALMQMVNHALVTAALFFIIAVLTARAKGPATLDRLGGMALRAPVLATLFLVVALATLAMPGTPNFVGEILILFGALEDKLVFGVVAGTGVVLAAVYMIRFFQRAMHNRAGEGTESRDLGGLDFAVIAPLALIIVGLGVYPQAILGPAEKATTARVKPAARVADRGGQSQAAEPAAQPQQAAPQQVPADPSQQVPADPSQQVPADLSQQVPVEPQGGGTP